MKKIALVAVVACMGLFAVSCKNQPKEAAPVEEQAQEVVDAAVEVSEEAAQTVKDAIDEASAAVENAVEEIKK